MNLYSMATEPSWAAQKHCSSAGTCVGSEGSLFCVPVCGFPAFLPETADACSVCLPSQDRSRLLPVAARLTQLGADLDATDAEGRTALHLAAGCGDRAMVLQLVELGSDVNSRDSVGGVHQEIS